MRRQVLASLLVLASALPAAGAVLDPSGDRTGATIGLAQPPAADRALIEVAILLDTSGSMQGLIDQARSRVWGIVNDLAKASKDGKTPELRVAVFDYGDAGKLRCVVPLTGDLDAVSEALFKLSIDGGEERCGEVIQRAVSELAWAPGDHYRAIFIAGNEPFDQGPVAWAAAVKAAVTRGVVVNTIHCGNADQGRAGHWVEAAKLGDGEALNIDHNQAEVAITAPQDGRIAELNAALNRTYLAFGTDGRRKAERQEKQDLAAATSAPAAASERAAAKAGSGYRNADWDLVDAVKDNALRLEEVSREDLPAELRDKSTEEIAAVVEAKRVERAGLQEQLRALAAERETFIAGERAKLGGKSDADFGAAVRGALSRQLAAKGYRTAGE